MGPGQSNRSYECPAVIYEAELEVRAGSPVGIPDLFDPLGIDR